MLDIKKIQAVTFAIMDVLPLKNQIAGSSINDIKESFKGFSDKEKLSESITILQHYYAFLEKEFKMQTLLATLETILNTPESNIIAKDIRKGVSGSIQRASVLIFANKDLIAEKVKEKFANNKPVERID